VKYRILGTSDLKASVIGLGTGQIGAATWGWGSKYDKNHVIKVIHKALDSGITLFDTAEMYGGGMSETLLGEALAGYERDDLVVVTKVAPWNLSHDGVIRAAERSLSRLGRRTLDLYLIHYPNPLVRLSETLRAMETLVKSGKVRHIGVSNFGRPLLRKACENLSTTKFVADEIEYNLFSHRTKSRLWPYCRSNDISLIAFSPLAGGLLTGKYSSDLVPGDRARAFNFLSRGRFLKKAEPLLGTLNEIARERGVSVPQVALSYLVREEGIHAIPAALTEEEVLENTSVTEISLNSYDAERIRSNLVSVDVPTYIFDNFIVRPISWTKSSVGAGAYLPVLPSLSA
jgi:aryl-alcohol dehydrogenase-like predicted oxidoreductase